VKVSIRLAVGGRESRGDPGTWRALCRSSAPARKSLA